MNEQEEIKKHIQECKTRIYNIRSFMKWNKDSDIEKCKENISLIETVIDALEKQIPKKIIAFDDGSGKCPVCGEKLHTGFMDSNYCHWCGQALTEF